MLPCARGAGGFMRAASIGVSVSATKSEIRTEPATVSPNEPRKLPTTPSTNTTGMNTAATDNVAAVAANAISRVPTRAACVGVLPAFAVALDILEHDDRVVDHDAHGERHAEQRHRVQRVAEQPDQPERGDQRDRDRRGDDQRRPRPAQEHEHREHREHRAEHERELGLFDRLPDAGREIDERDVLVDGEAVGEHRLDLVEAPEYLVHDRDRIAARLLEDADAHGGLAVVAVPGAVILGAVLDARDIGEIHRRAALVRDHEPAEVFERAELGVGLHAVLDLRAFDVAARHFDVLALQRGQDVTRRESARAQIVAVAARSGSRGPCARTCATPTTPGIVSKTGFILRRTNSLVSTAEQRASGTGSTGSAGR